VSFITRLNREVGENPTRSRHCKWEQAATCHCTNVWEGAASIDHEPGDLPVHCTNQTYEDREVPTGFMSFLIKTFAYSDISPSGGDVFIFIEKTEEK
jgi:hypothetical protein